MLFYIFFAASDRSKRASGTGFVADPRPVVADPQPVVEERTVVVEERRTAPAAEYASYDAGRADAGDPYGARFERRPVETVPETADERLARDAALRRGRL